MNDGFIKEGKIVSSITSVLRPPCYINHKDGSDTLVRTGAGTGIVSVGRWST